MIGDWETPKRREEFGSFVPKMKRISYLGIQRGTGDVRRGFRDKCSVGGAPKLWRCHTETCNSLPGELTVKVIESSCVLLGGNGSQLPVL